MTDVRPDETPHESGANSYWDRCFQSRTQSVDQHTLRSGGHPLDEDSGRRRRETLDDEINAILALLDSAKARRNDACSVSQLPDDVLSLVFKALIDDTVAVLQARANLDHAPRLFVEEDIISDDSESDDSEFSESQPSSQPSSPLCPELFDPLRYRWVICTFVCRRWRRVALGAPSLWKDVLVDLGPTWFQRFLTRSNGARGIQFYGFVSPSYEVLTGQRLSYSLDLSRTEVLSLRAKGRHALASFLRWFSFSEHPMVALKRVELSAITPLLKIEYLREFPLGDCLSASPSLQYVSLSNIIPSWNPAPPLPMQALTYLLVMWRTYKGHYSIICFPGPRIS
ncbi:hypothetical protein BC834DRAFT_373518 [Gloeopeniophorella convolvens]|nr:hypothetical protein BC834DRAFT_373518 [Gloeopeniophorella convolvens]